MSVEKRVEGVELILIVFEIIEMEISSSLVESDNLDDSISLVINKER